MRFITLLLGLIIASIVTGCAGSSSRPQLTAVQPASISQLSLSPIMYETYDCSQISKEAKGLTLKAEKISGISGTKPTENGIIFWPVSILKQNVSQKNSDLQRIKVQFEALEKASIREKCGFQFRREIPIVTEKSA